MKYGIKELEGNRSMLIADGEPMLVKLAMRPSTTAPGRIKCALYVDADEGVAPLPFAQAVMCGCDVEPHGWTPEWRLECN